MTSPHLLGAATWFVSHTWSYAFADVIDAVLLYFNQHSASEQDSVILWIDFFCDSQHARLPTWPPPLVEKNSKWFMDNFADLIAAIGSVLMVMQPWHAPLTLKRSWCVLELGHCARKSCTFDVAFTAEERSRFLAAMRSDASCLLGVIDNVNSMKSDCSRPSDRIAILKGIEGSLVSRAAFVHVCSARRGRDKCTCARKRTIPIVEEGPQGSPLLPRAYAYVAGKTNATRNIRLLWSITISRSWLRNVHLRHGRWDSWTTS